MQKPIFEIVASVLVIVMGIVPAILMKTNLPDNWLVDLVAIGHVAVYGGIGSMMLDDSIEEFRSQRAASKQARCASAARSRNAT